MGIPGDTLTSLSRLSNRQKVKSKGNPDDAFVPDVDGTSLEEAPPPPPPMPLPDSAQSFDARANQIIDPEAQAEEMPQEDPYYALGQNLAQMQQGPEQSETPIQEPLPSDVGAQVQEPAQEDGLMGRLGRGFRDILGAVKQEAGKPYMGIGPQIPSDVGAQVQEPAQEDGLMSRLGRGFRDILGAVKQEAGKSYMGIGPQTKEEAEQYMQPALLRYLNPANRKENAEYNAKVFEDNKLRSEARQQGLSLDEYKAQQADKYGQDQQTWQNEISEAVMNPYTKMVFGATDQVMNTPELKNKVEEQIGAQITPEQAEMIKKMEIANSDLTDQELKSQGAWDEQIGRIRDRLDQGLATNEDKMLIGLALLMPLIIGGLFGAQVGVGALGGAAEGLMNVYQRREDQMREDEKTLAELTKQRETSGIKKGELELERLKIPGVVKKALGPAPYEHLEGMKMVSFENADGQQVEGVEIKPGLVADLSYLSDKEDKSSMRKEAQELNEAKAAVNKLQMNTSKVIQIASQMKDSGTVEKIIEAAIKKKKPSLLRSMGTDVIVDGVKVNSAVALGQAVEDMLEARRQAQKIRNFGPQLFDHFERIVTNPIGEFTTMDDLVKQTWMLYKDTRDQFFDDVGNRGFHKEPAMVDFYNKDLQIHRYANRKEERRDAEEIKDELMGE